MELEALGEAKGFFGSKSFVQQGAFSVGVEVVLNEMNGVSVGVFQGQLLQEKSVFSFGALRVNLC